MNNTSKVEIYIALASAFINIDLNKSVAYCDSAIVLAKKIKFDAGVLAGLRHQAQAFSLQGKTIRGKELYVEVLSMALRGRIENEIVKSYNNLSTISNSLFESDSAIYYGKKSLALDSSRVNKKLVFTSLATAYRAKSDYITSLSYHMKNLALARETKDKNTEAKILTNIGNLHAVTKQYDIAIRYFEASATTTDTVNMRQEYANLNNSLGNVYATKGDYIKAEKYYKISLRLARQLGLKNLASQVLRNVGNTYNKRGRFRQSLDYYQQARVLAVDTRNENILCQLNMSFAFAYLGLNRPDKAEVEAKEGLLRARKLGLHSLRAEAYFKLYRVDSIRKNYQGALTNYQKSVDITDSLLSLEKTKQLLEMENKYENEKKSHEMKDLQLQVKTSHAETDKQKYKLYTVTSLLLASTLSFIIIFFEIKNRRKKKTQREIIQKHKDVILAQEEVQERIGRDLHDNIGQKMIALKMSLEENEAFGQEASQKAHTFLKEITADVRSLSHSVSPYILQTEGLETAFDRLLKTSFNNSPAQYTFESYNLKRKYLYEVEINLYRIGQELVTNILKHSQSHHLIVQLYENATHLILIMEDDGAGFKAPFKKGFGLRNIESRVRILNGAFHFESANGKTISTIRVPL